MDQNNQNENQNNFEAKNKIKCNDLNSETRKENLYFSPNIKLGPCNFKFF